MGMRVRIFTVNGMNVDWQHLCMHLADGDTRTQRDKGRERETEVKIDGEKDKKGSLWCLQLSLFAFFIERRGR